MNQNIRDNHPDISIIVPVYNVEKYLIRCLDSIFTQQFKGAFEVIAVDDGSSDTSLAVLRKYQEKEERLRIVEHGVNRKLSIARATGMNHSTGNYIMHVDADDWLLPDALERLHAKCLETEADIIVFNFVWENYQGKRTYIKNVNKQLVTSDKLKLQHLFYGATVNKIVKRDLIKDLLSGTVGICNTEDLLYATEIFLKAAKICVVPEFYYVYFINQESITWTTKPIEYLENQFLVLNQLQQIISKYEARSIYVENILNYFESWIYLQIAQIHFFSKENMQACIGLIKKFQQFPVMTPSRLRSLKLATGSKIFSLLKVLKYFGIRMSAGIILRSIKPGMRR